MGSRAVGRPALAVGAALAAAVALGVGAYAGPLASVQGLAPGAWALVGAALIGALLVAAVGYLAYWSDPAYTFTAALVLAPFAGHWEKLGLPGLVAPDRLLLIAAILSVLLGVPRVAGRSRPPIRTVHVVLALAVAWAVASALAAGTLGDRQKLLKLMEAFGVLPFLAFTLAPVVFRTERDRRVLLIGLVALGGYLGLTTLFETVGPRALVWPRYINDPSYGLHFGRGRGPSVDAVSNGFGLCVCAIASCIALLSWRRRPARLLAATVMALCLIGTVFTLERSVWIGTIAAVAAVVLATGELRRYALPIALGCVVVVASVLALVPGLSDQVRERGRAQHSVWDRRNLNDAGIRMVEARPLWGFGWQRFRSASPDFFHQSQDFPLTAVGLDIHNVFLTYAVELGLIGLALWGLGAGLAILGALSVRGPPDLRLWRLGLLGVAALFLVTESFVPPNVFESLALWLWAGVVWAGVSPGGRA